MGKSELKPGFCVFEADPNGHRLSHVKILVEYIFRKTKTKPLFLTTEAVLKSAPYKAHLKGIQKKFRVSRLNWGEKMGPLGQVLGLRKAFRDLQAEGIGKFLIPTSDHLVEAFGLASLCGFKFDGLEIRFGVLRLGIAYPGRKFQKRVIHSVNFFLQSRAPGRRFYLDEYAARTIREKRGLPLDSAPDPFLSFEFVKNKKSRKPFRGPVTLGMVGGIDTRKGFGLLMAAFQDSNAKKTARLRLAGSFDERSRKILGEMKRAGGLEGSLEILDRHLGAREFWKNLGDLDVVCLPYPGHIGPSAIFAQSAALGKVILASDYGWLGWEGKKYAKTIFFKNGSRDSLREKMDYVVENFDKLNRRRANYVPLGPDRYAGIFTGLGSA